MIVITLRVNRNDTQCLRKIQLKDEIINLLTKVKHGLQHELDIPNVNYDIEGGTRSPNFSSDEVTQAYAKHQINVGHLNDKMSMFIAYAPNIKDSLESYAMSTNQFLMKYGERDNNFHDLWRQVDEAHAKLVSELNKSEYYCK
ncbi:MAG: hypothetical protein K9M03_04425 [Kiritimatiellales bacterium]|nr:hypothetical protein [Kiritimatiellales bacterium]